MTRRLEDDAHVFSAVVDFLSPGGSLMTQRYGPYATKGAATAYLNRTRIAYTPREGSRFMGLRFVSGHVERGRYEWEPIDPSV